jgi:hypothetical protein
VLCCSFRVGRFGVSRWLPLNTPPPPTHTHSHLPYKCTPQVIQEEANDRVVVGVLSNALSSDGVEGSPADLVLKNVSVARLSEAITSAATAGCVSTRARLLLSTAQCVVQAALPCPARAPAPLSLVPPSFTMRARTLTHTRSRHALCFHAVLGVAPVRTGDANGPAWCAAHATWCKRLNGHPVTCCLFPLRYLADMFAACVRPSLLTTGTSWSRF